MKKRKLFLDEIKEEKWLNDMSANGWHLTKFQPLLATYTFEQDSSKSYTYRLDLIAGLPTDYVAFIEESGADIIHQNGFWTYFRKESTAGEFVLYSDAPSKIAMLQRMLLVYMFVMIFNIMITAYNLNVNEGAILMQIIAVINTIAAVTLVPFIIHTIRRILRLKRQIQPL